MAMEWSDALSVGNEILDADHKALLGLAGDIQRAIRTRDYPALACAYKSLRGCMERHFLNEELLAHALGIPFDEHRLDHQNMLAGIDIMRREIEKNSGDGMPVVEHYALFLQDCLARHVAEKDMLMKPVLQTRHYGFRVEGVFAGS